MAKAVGIGGVFLKARDPQALAAWYAKHLGIPAQDGGPGLRRPGIHGHDCLCSLSARYEVFWRGRAAGMVNFRVDDFDELLKQLAEAGVRIDPKRDDHYYGQFAWIWDAEGNRVELWQPL